MGDLFIPIIIIIIVTITIIDFGVLNYSEQSEAPKASPLARFINLSQDSEREKVQIPAKPFF